MRLAVFDYGAGNLHSLGKALQMPGVIVSVETEPRLLLSADAIVLPGVGAFGAAAARLAPVRAEIAAALSAGMPCLGICLGMQLLFDASDESPGSPGLGVIRGHVVRLRAARVPHMGWNAVTWCARSPVDSSTQSTRDSRFSDAPCTRDSRFSDAPCTRDSRFSDTPSAADSRFSASEASDTQPGASGPHFSASEASDAKRRSEPDVAYFAHSYACRPRDESVVTAWTVEDTDRFPSAVRWRNVVGVQFHPEKSSSPGVRFIHDFLGAI